MPAIAWAGGLASRPTMFGTSTRSLRSIGYIENYMLGGQYKSDVDVVVEQIFAYLGEIELSGDGKDAWVLDVDDTCISNLMYYAGKHYG